MSYTFKVRVVASTAKAVLFDFEDDGEKWVPLSVIDYENGDLEDFSKGDEGTVAIAEWWCEKEGLT